MKLALAFVSCRDLACGEIYLLQTLCSIGELFIAFYFVAGYILLPSSCFWSINSSVPLFVPIILNYLLELLIDETIFQ
jgi:hypothetical protein